MNQAGCIINLQRLAQRFVRGCSGTAAIEFAFVAPVLIMLVIGAAKFGLTFHDYITLTNGVESGARLFAISRGGSSPYTNAVAQVRASAPDLAASNLTITISVNGTACSSDGTCTTALNTSQGLPASVRATYPCDLVVYGIDFLSGCTLASSTTEYVQ